VDDFNDKLAFEYSRIKERASDTEARGEKWLLKSERFGTLATIVRLPGTKLRIYWPNNGASQHSTSDHGTFREAPPGAHPRVRRGSAALHERRRRTAVARGPQGPSVNPEEEL
jgi:hypothetical protein